MAKYVFSYRVPIDYPPGPETGPEWQAWLGGGVEVGPVMEAEGA